MSDFLERLQGRLEPVLERVERLLAGFVGDLPGVDAFEGHHAFRWRSSRGVGRLEPIETSIRQQLVEPARLDLAVNALLVEAADI